MEVLHRRDSHPLQTAVHSDLENTHPPPQIQHQNQAEISTIEEAAVPTERITTPAPTEQTMSQSSRSPSVGLRAELSSHTPSASPARDLGPVPQSISQIDGQDHDRMETDNEENAHTPSGSETPGPSNEASDSPPPENEPVDGEAMDTRPDDSGIVVQNSGFPTSVDQLQMLMDEQVAMAMGNEDLVRMSDGEALHGLEGLSAEEQEAALNAVLNSSSSQAAVPDSTENDSNEPSADIAAPPSNSDNPAPDDGNNESSPVDQVEQSQENTGQDNDMQQQEPNQAPNDGPDNTTPLDNPTVPDNDPQVVVPPPTQSGDQNNDEEDTSDEDENPYWARFKQDTSSPDEDELKEMEDSNKQTDALSHDHWEKKIFETLEDPEYIPDDIGRIEWTVKGVHGTPDKPNKESIMHSPSVLIGGFYWHIKYFPRGNERTDMMSLYIECSDTPYERKDEKEKEDKAQKITDTQTQSTSQSGQEVSEQPQEVLSTESVVLPKRIHSDDSQTSSNSESKRWECPAQIGCVVYNPNETSVYVNRRSCHRFHHETEDWGWTRFTGPWAEMHQRKHCEKKPLLQDDTISFTAYIRTFKDHTGSLWWHPPNDRDWDSHERFGLRSLQSDILSPPALPAALLALAPLRPFVDPLKSVCNGLSNQIDIRPREVASAMLHIASSMMEKSTKGFDVPVGQLGELLRSHCSDVAKMDVVELWENLRSIASVEAAGLPPGSDASDVFSDLAVIRQPDRIALNRDPKVQAVKGLIALCEPNNVQQTLSSILPLNPIKNGLPAIMMIELHRQEFLEDSRRWRKMTHKIGLNRKVVVHQNEKRIEYSLFGMIVHSGGLESNHYSTIIQPDGPETRWIKYGSVFDEKKAECLTTKQVFDKYEGEDGADENTAVAYVALYARTDRLKGIFTRSHTQSTSEKKSETQELKSDEAKVPDSSTERLKITVYGSEGFKNHSGRGTLDPWSPKHDGIDDIMSFDVMPEEGMKTADNLIKEALGAKHPDEDHKFSLFGLDYNPKYFLRGPTPFLSYHSVKALEDPSSKLHGCRLWLHRLDSEEKSIVEEIRSQRKRQKLSHKKEKISSKNKKKRSGHDSASSEEIREETSGEREDPSLYSSRGDGETGGEAGTNDSSSNEISAVPAGDLMDVSDQPVPEVEREQPPLEPTEPVIGEETQNQSTPAVRDDPHAEVSPSPLIGEVAPIHEPPNTHADDGLTTSDPPESTESEVMSVQTTEATVPPPAVPPTDSPTPEATSEQHQFSTQEPPTESITTSTMMPLEEAPSETVPPTDEAANDATNADAVDPPHTPPATAEQDTSTLVEALAEANPVEDVVMGGTQEASGSQTLVDEAPIDGPECSEDLQEYTYVLVKRFDPHEQSLKGISSFYCKKTEQIISAIRRKLSIDDDSKAIDVYQERTLLPSKDDRITDTQTFNDLSDRTQGRIFVIQDRLSEEEITALTTSGLPPTIPLHFSTLLSLETPSHRLPHLTTHYFSSPYLSTPLSHSLPHGSPAHSISLSGDQYTGPFLLGTKSGPSGSLTYSSSGDIYTGEFHSDLPHGQGTMKYHRTGNVYEGGWKRGKWFGKGVMRFERAEAEARECAICWEEEMSSAVMPCGHLVACEGCARQVEICPVCRRGVTGVLRVWVS